MLIMTFVYVNYANYVTCSFWYESHQSRELHYNYFLPTITTHNQQIIVTKKNSNSFISQRREKERKKKNELSKFNHFKSHLSS